MPHTSTSEAANLSHPSPKNTLRTQVFNHQRKQDGLHLDLLHHLWKRKYFIFHFLISHGLSFCPIWNKTAHGLWYFESLSDLSSFTVFPLPLRKHISVPVLQIKISFSKARLGETSAVPIAACFYSPAGSNSKDLVEAACGSPQV